MKQQDQDVYDLGEVELGKTAPGVGSIRGVPRPGPVRRELRPQPAGVSPTLAGSLSLFVPGLGQMVSGEIAWGAFYLTWMGLCVSCLWAMLTTLDRLGPTLRLFNVSPEVLIIALGAFASLAVMLHLAAIVHAQTAAALWDPRFAAHPLVAGLASLLMPGWGQLLAGHFRRAVLFLFVLWTLGWAWLLVTPAGMRVLSRLGLHVPGAMRDGWGPVAMLAAPAVLWVIAVYDAAAGAAAERNA